MGSKIGNVTEFDSNALANEIMFYIQDVEQMESDFGMELSSEELFRLDSAILSSLRNTQDFSRDLIVQLEKGLLRDAVFRPPKISDELPRKAREDTDIDLTIPLRNMFCEMEELIVEALR